MKKQYFICTIDILDTFPNDENPFDPDDYTFKQEVILCTEREFKILVSDIDASRFRISDIEIIDCTDKVDAYDFLKIDNSLGFKDPQGEK